MTRTLLRYRVALTGTALFAGVVLSACGSSNDHGSMPGMGAATNAAPTGSATATFTDADVAFAQHMIPHHQQAVAMAALADTRATDPEVKTLAEQIKATQDPEITKMAGWLSAWGKPAPGASMSGMDMGGMDMGDGSMPGMMSDADMTKLGAASGTNFDTQFLQMMIEHHQGAISMANDEVAGGKNPDATTLARQIITSQQAEINTMKKILARL
jgi:uncharacterized protein (DUF305 family)